MNKFDGVGRIVQDGERQGDENSLRDNRNLFDDLPINDVATPRSVAGNYRFL